MTEPEAAPTPSLIQQRLTLQRRRTMALVGFVVQALIGAALVVLLFLDGDAWFRWLGLLVFVASAGYYGFLLRGVLTETRAFEEQHGRDAGVQ